MAVHLTMLNAIIGGGGSCDFVLYRVASHVYPPYSELLLQLLV